jgi:transcription initiation factor TFIID subunit 1
MDDDDVSVTGSINSSYHVNNQNKYLIIRRMIRQPNGEKTWQQDVFETTTND